MQAHQVLELFCCIVTTNASKSLTAMQQRYAPIEQEVLAVVPGCQRFHQYIYGKKVVIQSDHKPLEVIMKKPLHNTSPRLQRMLLSLQKYIDLVYDIDFWLRKKTCWQIPCHTHLEEMT